MTESQQEVNYALYRPKEQPMLETKIDRLYEAACFHCINMLGEDSLTDEDKAVSAEDKLDQVIEYLEGTV